MGTRDSAIQKSINLNTIMNYGKREYLPRLSGLRLNLTTILVLLTFGHVLPTEVHFNWFALILIKPINL